MPKRVVVVGAGIAGLAAAHRLERLSAAVGAGVEVRLLEGAKRAGGKLLTERAGGLLIEGGPDSFLAAKPQARALARSLGLGGLLVPSGSGDAGVFVYARGRMRRVPDGLTLLAPTRLGPFLASNLLSWRGRLRAALEPLLPPGGGGEESMAAFGRRRFGREVVETLVQPVMAGIFAGDAEQLSLESTFPRLLALEREYGSVLRGLWSARSREEGGGPAEAGFLTLSGGLEQLARALALSLGPALRVGCPVNAVRKDGGGYRVELCSGGFERADVVILTPMAWQAADLLEGLDPELAGALREIPFVSTATVSLAWPDRDLPPLPGGYGFVVARSELRCVAAATFSSRKFPGRAPPGTTLLRCFLGGAGREAPLRWGDAELLEAVREDLARLLGIRARPSLERLHRWPRANPQYALGHAERLRRIDSRLEKHPGLLLAGASYRGVGIPDCIASGERAAAETLKFV